MTFDFYLTQCEFFSILGSLALLEHFRPPMASSILVYQHRQRTNPPIEHSIEIGLSFRTRRYMRPSGLIVACRLVGSPKGKVTSKCWIFPAVVFDVTIQGMKSGACPRSSKFLHSKHDTTDCCDLPHRPRHVTCTVHRDECRSLLFNKCEYVRALHCTGTLVPHEPRSQSVSQTPTQTPIVFQALP